MLAEILSFGGASICGLVGVKMLTTVADSLQRFSAERGQFRLRNQSLRNELARLSRAQSGTESSVGWEGWRKFRVQSKVEESAGCHSIYLVPHDGKQLPSFHPGQFLTFSVRLPNESKPVVRCYSLSDAPNGTYYRCSVKIVPPRSEEFPAGRVSTFFNESLQEGDILDVKAPRGGFYLDMTREDPIVLLAGGIGITPLLSMLNTIAAFGSRRPVYMFCGFRNGVDHPFKSHLQRIRDNYPNVQLHVAYSAPNLEDTVGEDCDSEGYVTLDLLKQTLPSNNFDFYLCGPGPFMNAVDGALQKWGVPTEAIHSEAFGPASVAKPKPPKTESGSATPVETAVSVCFSRSNLTVPWDSSSESLLELAERHNVAIDSGCRSGNCGTCLTAVRSGSVKYTQEPDAEVDEGSCLTCIATPDSNVELDA